jgi:hypothetical protein
MAEKPARPTWDRYVHAERVERESIIKTVSAWKRRPRPRGDGTAETTH